MDDEVRAQLQSLQESVDVLTDNSRFTMQMDQRSLGILVRMAYVLERLSNRVLGVDDREQFGKAETEQIFREIRTQLEEQRKIMQGRDSPPD